MAAARVQARRGSIQVHTGRQFAQVSLDTDASSRRIRRNKSFDRRTQTEALIATQQLEHRQLANPVTEDRVVDQRNVSRALHRARTTAGVDHDSLTTIRSTVAIQLAEAGLHPSSIQAFLGHAHVITTTTTYNTAVDGLDEAADHLPELLDIPTSRPLASGHKPNRSDFHLAADAKTR